MRNSFDTNEIKSPDVGKWKQIELAISDNLQIFENGRKFCAYCGRNEVTNEENEKSNQKCLILGRCYGCQMVYYCSQEHQHLDWLEHHMPKCAELEWVALGEIIQSIPANPAMTTPGMLWPSDFIPQTWTDWFGIRNELVQIAKKTAIALDRHCFAATKKPNQINLILNKLNRREPTISDLVDGLLSAVTDSMTYALTIGNSLKKVGIDPNTKPACIHLLHPPNELIEDLSFLIQSTFENSEQLSSQMVTEAIDNYLINKTIKKKFYELTNMFPDNKGIEIVFISMDTHFEKMSSVDWSKLLCRPFMKTEMNKSLPLSHKDLYISAWQGTYSNYIGYACQIEGYSLPDLVVSFHPSFTSSPQKLINDWTDDLKVILNNKFPCLLTFSDKDENQKAYNVLSAFQSNFLSVQSNQFSSLMLKQINGKPNSVYAANSFYIIIDGFADVNSESRFVANSTQQTANESIKRSKSIHEILNNHKPPPPPLKTESFHKIDSPIQTHQQNDACIQTLGLEEPTNQSLRQINGKLQITKSLTNSSTSSSFSSHSSYNSTSVSENYSITNKCNQIKMISASHLNSKEEYEISQMFPRDTWAPHQKQRQTDQPIYTRPTPIPPPLDLNTTTNLKKDFTFYDTLEPNDTTSIKYVDDSVCSSQVTLQDEPMKPPTIQVRSRRSSLPSQAIKSSLTSTIVPINTHQVSAPPAAKPRVLNLTETKQNPLKNTELVESFLRQPETKPRAMKPTRLLNKYSSPSTEAPTLTKQITDEPENPLPKPRVSVQPNIDMITATDDKLAKFTSDLTDSGHQSSEMEIISNDECHPKTSQEHNSDDNSIQLSYFKASIVKASPCSENKLTDFLKSRRSSSTSPSSSSSVLSSSSSPQTSTSQAIVSYSSLSSSSYKSSTNQSPKKTAIISDSSPSAGIVSQMKNIFESNLNANNTSLVPNESIKSLRSRNASPVRSTPPIPTTSVPKDQPEPDYVNVSNKYLAYLKSKQSNKPELLPPSAPPLPPLTPPLPASSPPSLSPKILKQPTNEYLVAKIISKPPEAPNKHQNETNIETITLTTTTTTLALSSQRSSSANNRPNSRLMSTSNTNMTEFRIMSTNQQPQQQPERSTTPTGKSMTSLSQSNFSLNSQNLKMINHIPNSVDVLNFKYEGQRQIVVPGYMTSADILRNMLLKQPTPNQNSPVVAQRQQMSLKEKLMLQNQSDPNYQHEQLHNPINNYITGHPNSYNVPQGHSQNQKRVSYQSPMRTSSVKVNPNTNSDKYFERLKIEQKSLAQANTSDDLDKKFARNTRVRSMSGVVTLEVPAVNNVIDINFDDQNEPEPDRSDSYIARLSKPVEQYSTVHKINEIMSTSPAKQPQQQPQQPIKPSMRISQLINEDKCTQNGSSRMSSRRLASLNSKQGVTGSFDASDFDSFDEDEDGNRSYRPPAAAESKIPMEPMEKIREEALLQHRLEVERDQQKENQAQFDPNDFDSFDEDSQHDQIVKEVPPTQNQEEEQEEQERRQSEFISNRNRIEAMFKNNSTSYEASLTPPVVKTQTLPQITQSNESPDEQDQTHYLDEENIPCQSLDRNQSPMYQASINKEQSSSFFRSALDRLSNRSRSKSKSRSSSVPMRKFIQENNLEFPDEFQPSPNMKTVHLMTKMQNDLDEKQKRKKHRQQRKLNLEKSNELSKSTSEVNNNPPKSPKTPTGERKFLSSIMNTLFNSNGQEQHDPLQKNEAKRLSLRKLKAKDKMKKKEPEYPDETYEEESYDVNKSSFDHSDFNETFRKSNRSLNFNPMSTDDYEVSPEANVDNVAFPKHYNKKQSNFNRSTSFDNGSLSKLANLNNIIKPNSIGTTSINTRKFGKIKNEETTPTEPLNDNKKENIMKQLKAELDEEVKDRRYHEMKQNIINGTLNNDSDSDSHRKSTAFEDIPYNSESLQAEDESKKSLTLNRKSRAVNEKTGNRKIRSKSVTFLDEISSTDDDSRQNSKIIPTNHFERNNTASKAPVCQPRASQRQKIETPKPPVPETLTTPSSGRKISLKTGDVRLMCGALTGAGPIRSIMKKSATDLSISIGSPLAKPKFDMYEDENEIAPMQIENLTEEKQYPQQVKPRVSKSQTAPNLFKRKEIMQSDL